MDKSLFYLLLALVCFYLVLSEFYGDKYITSAVIKLIPKSED